MKINKFKNMNTLPQNILKQGKVNYFIEAPEDADPEEYKKKQIELDLFGKRIKPITENTLIEFVCHKYQI